MSLNVEVGRRLQEARIYRGYRSARAFANDCHIPESTYSQHETGKRSLNPLVLLNYSNYLKTDVGWLVSGRQVVSGFSGRQSALFDELIATPSELLPDQHAPEARLNTSYRTENPYAVPVKNLQNTNLHSKSIDFDILKIVLTKAIGRFCNKSTVTSHVDVDVSAMIAYCFRAYNNIMVMSSKTQAQHTLREEEDTTIIA